jgi:hypothetical protein
MTDLLAYLNRIAPKNLRVAPARSDTRPFPGGGNSPYKQILLLVVLQMIRKRDKGFSRGLVDFNVCGEEFAKLVEALYDDGPELNMESMVVQPYWYFGAGVPRLWDLVPQDGRSIELKQAIASGTQIKTRSKLERLVALAEIKSSDLDLLNDDTANAAIRGYVVSTYFQGIESHVFSVLGTR